MKYSRLRWIIVRYGWNIVWWNTVRSEWDMMRYEWNTVRYGWHMVICGGNIVRVVYGKDTMNCGTGRGRIGKPYSRGKNGTACLGHAVLRRSGLPLRMQSVPARLQASGLSWPLIPCRAPSPTESAAAVFTPPVGLYLPTRTKTLRSGASMTATWPDSVGNGLRIQLISVFADSAS